MSNLNGQSLGRYHILEQLGEGGMAIVYKAYDTRLETDVAVKVIRTEKLTEENTVNALKRFEREAKALARLTHPNIVKVTDFGEHDGKPYLVMPYLPGGTLKTKLGTLMPWEEAARLILPIAQALEYAHEHNVIHRDIKPSNILLTEKGQPMLTDFGIAKMLDLVETVDLTGTSAAVGTPEYMAPEQVSAKTVDHRVDIYALGIVLYEMVTGRKPFIADTPMAVLIMQVRDPLPSPKKFAPNLPDNAEKILIKTLAKEPEDRYQNMGELVSALEKVAETRKTADTAPPPPVRMETIEEKTTAFSSGPVSTAPPPLYSEAAEEKKATWLKWIPLGVLVILLGCTLTIGSGLLSLGRQGKGPFAGLATDTPSPTSTATLTQTPTQTQTPTPSPCKAAIYMAEGSSSRIADVQEKLLSTGFFLSVDGFKVEEGYDNPSLADLDAYRVVLVYSNDSFGDPDELGNVLADYVDAGGGVVVSVFAYNSSNLGLAGRFREDGYLPFTQESQKSGDLLTMVKDLPDHPILSGIGSFNGGEKSYHNPISLTSGALLIAHWDNGYPLIAVKQPTQGRIVGLNFYPPSEDARDDLWDTATDGAQLLGNALAWAGQCYMGR